MIFIKISRSLRQYVRRKIDLPLYIGQIHAFNFDTTPYTLNDNVYRKSVWLSKIEKVPRGIRGEKSSKDMASSRNLVSTSGALASPKMGDGTRCPEG